MAILPLEQLSIFGEQFVAFLPGFIAGVLVFAAFYLLYLVTVLILRTAMERKKVHASIISLTVKSYKYVLILVGFILSLYAMGVDFMAAVAGLGIASVAIGFAGRDSLSNYIAGVTIFWDKPFYVGDYIEVSELYGRVTEITMRSTRIRTLNNEYLIVPNQTIVDSLVVNHSKNGEVRVEIPVGISYHDSISLAREALLTVIDPEQDPRLSQYLRPTVIVDSLGDNGVDLLFRVWINKAEDEKAIFYDYIERAKVSLEEHGITIPFPQRVLHNVPWQENQPTPHLENSH